MAHQGNDRAVWCVRNRLEVRNHQAVDRDFRKRGKSLLQHRPIHQGGRRMVRCHPRNRRFVRSFNGKLLFEEDLNNKNENDLIKNENIKKIKEQISNEIYNKYPISKQIDIIARIGGYTDDDFNDMKDFINTKVNEYRNLKKNL